MKVLFLCNQNQNRSKTAEVLFSTEFETQSAGLYNSCPVTSEELDWAEIICVMEEDQRRELAKRFPKQYMKKRILCLEVPDVYYYNSPELVNVLKSRFSECLAIL